MKNIILFAPPGGGKGTQAKKIVKKSKLIHLSTGDILREELASMSELAIQAKEFMSKGELVPDEIVINMIDKKIKNNINARGFIFDGFPRTLEQAKALDKLLEKNNLDISIAIRITVDQKELIKRLQSRAEIEGREDDKNIDIIKNRIKVYIDNTYPIFDYYIEQKKLYKIDGNRTVEHIYNKINYLIDEKSINS